MEITRYDVYKSILKNYREESLCLDEDKLLKEDLFLFVYDYYAAGVGGRRMVHNLREYCRINHLPERFKPKAFKVVKGYIIGSLFDSFRFYRKIKTIEKFIERNINSFCLDDKAVAEISKEEIEKMKNRFRITLFRHKWKQFKK